MGLTCTLLGHVWGATETSREREDRGEEVVVTVQEYRECVRCGEEDVLSENTEVRPVADEPAEVEEVDSTPDPAATGGNHIGVEDRYEPPGGADEEDAMILDDDERERGEWPDPDANRGGTDEEDPGASDAESSEDSAEEVDDDVGGIIIDDGPSETDEAPATDTGGVETESPDDDEPEPPSETADNGGMDASPPSADEAAEEEPETDSAPSSQGADNTDAGPRETPADDGATFIDGAPEGTTGGLDDTAEDFDDDASGPTTDTTVDVPGGSWPDEGSGDNDAETIGGGEEVLVCPECGHRTPASDTSLRSGDSCPNCSRGWLKSE